MTAGQRIRTARKKAGMTQAELAARLNVPFQSVSQWERDIRNPKKETLDRIAKALDISADILYEITDEKKVEIEKSVDYIFSNLNPEKEHTKDEIRDWLISDEIDGQMHNAFLDAMESGDEEFTNRFKDIPDIYLERQLIEYYRTLNRRGRIEAVIRLMELSDYFTYRFRNRIGLDIEGE